MSSEVAQEAFILSAVCQAMPDPIFIIDQEGTYTNVFGGSERNLYDSVDYLKRKRLADILPSVIAERFISTVKKAIETNSLQIIEYELTSLDMHFNPMDGPTEPQHYEGRVFPLGLSKNGKKHVVWIAINITEKKKNQLEREKVTGRLKKALEEIKILRGILPICSNCRKIRDEKGHWKHIELYIQEHSEAKFSHSICPVCQKILYPDFEI